MRPDPAQECGEQTNVEFPEEKRPHWADAELFDELSQLIDVAPMVPGELFESSTHRRYVHELGRCVVGGRRLRIQLSERSKAPACWCFGALQRVNARALPRLLLGG